MLSIFEKSFPDDWMTDWIDLKQRDKIIFMYHYGRRKKNARYRKVSVRYDIGVKEEKKVGSVAFFPLGKHDETPNRGIAAKESCWDEYSKVSFIVCLAFISLRVYCLFPSYILSRSNASSILNSYQIFNELHQINFILPP